MGNYIQRRPGYYRICLRFVSCNFVILLSIDKKDKSINFFSKDFFETQISFYQLFLIEENYTFSKMF